MKILRAVVAAVFVAAALPTLASANELQLEGGESGAGPTRLAAESYPTSIAGGVLELGEWKGQTKLFEIQGFEPIHCEVKYESETLHLAATDSFEVGAEYPECEDFEGYEVVARTNSCGYEFSDLTSEGSLPSYAADSAIDCDSGDSIELGLKLQETEFCTIKLPPQTLNEEQELLNGRPEGQRKIAVGVATTTLEYAIEGPQWAEGDPWWCEELAGLESGSGSDGGFRSDMLLGAADEGEPFEGMRLEGGQAETDPARLAAGSYPAHISGGVFEAGPLKGQTKVFESEEVPPITCDVEYEGDPMYLATVGGFDVGAQYSDCEFDYWGEELQEMKWEVETNSCRYDFSGLEHADLENAYSASSSIDCDGEDAIEARLIWKEYKELPLCTISLPPQLIKKKQELVTGKLEGKWTVDAAVATGSLDYAVEGPYCEYFGFGEGGDGSFHSDMLLSAAS